MFIMSVVFMSLGFIIVYQLFKELFNKNTGVFAALAYPASVFLARGILKYTDLIQFVCYPLLFLFVIYFFKKERKLLYAVLTGLMYGVCSLAHGMGFILISLLVPILAFYLLFFQFFDYDKKKFDKDKIKETFWKNVFYLGIIISIGFLISLIFWWIPITLLFGSKEGFGISYIYSFSTVIKPGLKKLFDFTSLRNSIVSILFIISILIPLFIKKLKSKTKNLYLFSIVIFLLPFHFFITKPILGFTLIPNHMINHLYPIILIILSAIGFNFILSSFPKYKKYIAIVIVALLIITSLILVSSWLKNDQWAETSRLKLPKSLHVASEWIKNNTDVNDMFISNKELASSINALTGRKFVALRYNHMSKFDHRMQREADLAVILHGENDEKREELIKKYDVKYLYWDNFWMTSDFLVMPNGDPVLFDPVSVYDNSYYRSYFEQNGVNYSKTKMTIDPSKRERNDVTRPDLLVVLASNKNIMEPWNDKLDKYLTLHHTIKEGDKVLAKIYKVELN